MCIFQVVPYPVHNQMIPSMVPSSHPSFHPHISYNQSIMQQSTEPQQMWWVIWMSNEMFRCFDHQITIANLMCAKNHSSIQLPTRSKLISWSFIFPIKIRCNLFFGGSDKRNSFFSRKEPALRVQITVSTRLHAESSNNFWTTLVCITLNSETNRVILWLLIWLDKTSVLWDNTYILT